ncbi:hypothetical protein CEXT_141451 [Caerostris extrusa]|uniref:Uncharacterized protein n=1 Tax=Caerostris extrusa TaxID=172846 RepID=A0AAV4R4I4_CAEEX|nr:hypothetical protein CEXT_141451 [Caerostris extrusa]
MNFGYPKIVPVVSVKNTIDISSSVNHIRSTSKSEPSIMPGISLPKSLLLWFSSNWYYVPALSLMRKHVFRGILYVLGSMIPDSASSLYTDLFSLILNCSKCRCIIKYHGEIGGIHISI